MAIVLLGLACLVLVFGIVVFFGAPYLPTMRAQTEAALDLLQLKPGQTLLELGSGDGTVLKAAAQRGLRVVGYELNPLLVIISIIRTRKYRKEVKVIWGNYWRHTWPQTDGIYTFLLDKYMKKLDKKITQSYPDKTMRLASLAFKIPGKKTTRELKGVYLYIYLPKKGA